MLVIAYYVMMVIMREEVMIVGSRRVRFRIIKKKECRDCAPVLHTAKKRNKSWEYKTSTREEGYKRSLPTQKQTVLS